jgi:hypothetical protein
MHQMDNNDDRINFVEILDNIIKDSDIPKYYSNGFITSIGNGDALIIFQQNGITIASLNLSYTVAKTLSLKLGEIIKKIENGTGNAIMITADMDKVIQNIDQGKQQ